MSTAVLLKHFTAKAAAPKGSTPEEQAGYRSAMESMGLNTNAERPIEKAIVDLSGGIHGASFTWENSRDISGRFLAGARRGLRDVELALAGIMDGLGLDEAFDGAYSVPRDAFP
jgi:hypothetical protein